MNQVRIGKFIAERRKNQKLTQMQLAEKLSVTDKAVSKWERGISLPDSSIMLELCEILNINVNELLSGEKISMENNSEKNKQLLLELTKESQQKDKRIMTAMWVILTVCIIGFLASMAIAAFLIPEGIGQLVWIIASCVIFLIPCFYALKLEVSVGVYKCRNCGHGIVPTYKQVMASLHLGTTRYLKCPNCGKRTWCKKVLNDENDQK